MMQDFDKLQARLDQMGLELLARAANLDVLAGVIEQRMLGLEARERDLDMRERDLLMAGEELKTMAKGTRQCQKTS